MGDRQKPAALTKRCKQITKATEKNKNIFSA